MKRLDSNDLLLCRMQGRLFEASSNMTLCGSAVFVRRFMNSQLADRMDSGTFLFESSTQELLFEELEQEFGPSSYGSARFAPDELYWMGYLYRYWACAFQTRSAHIFKCIGAKELRELFVPYHSLDPEQAIRRIAEAKAIELEKSLDVVAVETLRTIRSRHPRYEYQVTAVEDGGGGEHADGLSSADA